MARLNNAGPSFTSADVVNGPPVNFKLFRQLGIRFLGCTDENCVCFITRGLCVHEDAKYLLE